jgi:hypothetical protein
MDQYPNWLFERQGPDLRPTFRRYRSVDDVRFSSRTNRFIIKVSGKEGENTITEENACFVPHGKNPYLADKGEFCPSIKGVKTRKGHRLIYRPIIDGIHHPNPELSDRLFDLYKIEIVNPQMRDLLYQQAIDTLTYNKRKEERALSPEKRKKRSEKLVGSQCALRAFQNPYDFCTPIDTNNYHYKYISQPGYFNYTYIVEKGPANGALWERSHNYEELRQMRVNRMFRTPAQPIGAGSARIDLRSGVNTTPKPKLVGVHPIFLRGLRTGLNGQIPHEQLLAPLEYVDRDEIKRQMNLRREREEAFYTEQRERELEAEATSELEAEAPSELEAESAIMDAPRAVNETPTPNEAPIISPITQQPKTDVKANTEGNILREQIAQKYQLAPNALAKMSNKNLSELLSKQNLKLRPNAEKVNQIIDFYTLITDEPGVAGGYTYGMCPVCLQFRAELSKGGCLYHTDNCLNNQRNERLFRKYNLRGQVEFCFTCGRACLMHAHYKLTEGNERPDVYSMNPGTTFWDCTNSGGGGRKELMARLLGVINYLNSLTYVYNNKENQSAMAEAAERAANDPRFLEMGRISLEANNPSTRKFVITLNPKLRFVESDPEKKKGYLYSILSTFSKNFAETKINKTKRSDFELTKLILETLSTKITTTTCDTIYGKHSKYRNCPADRSVPKVVNLGLGIARNNIDPDKYKNDNDYVLANLKNNVKKSGKYEQILNCYVCKLEDTISTSPVYRFKHANIINTIYEHTDDELICYNHLISFIKNNIPHEIEDQEEDRAVPDPNKPDEVIIIPGKKITRQSAPSIKCFIEYVNEGDRIILGDHQCGGIIHPCELRDILRKENPTLYDNYVAIWNRMTATQKAGTRKRRVAKKGKTRRRGQ